MTSTQDIEDRIADGINPPSGWVPLRHELGMVPADLFLSFGEHAIVCLFILHKLLDVFIEDSVVQGLGEA